MTTDNTPMTYHRIELDGDALVVAFDMCSSTDVIEELTLSGNLQRYEQLLTAVKEHLAAAQEAVLFEPYKFTGDGWILLFPVQSDGMLVFECLRNLCAFYQKTFQRLILGHLATPPQVTGLTFGIERGPLRRLRMYGQQEYVGRTLNVACRLQAAVKDSDPSPQYKALVSKAAFHDYFSESRKQVQVRKVKRQLRNIRGGAVFQCIKIEFLNRLATP